MTANCNRLSKATQTVIPTIAMASQALIIVAHEEGTCTTIMCLVMKWRKHFKSERVNNAVENWMPGKSLNTSYEVMSWCIGYALHFLLPVSNLTLAQDIGYLDGISSQFLPGNSGIIPRLWYNRSLPGKFRIIIYQPPSHQSHKYFKTLTNS
jgi:hypothetical protein